MLAARSRATLARRTAATLAAAALVAVSASSSAPVAAAPPASAPPSADACVRLSERGLAAREKGLLREARSQFIGCAADTCPKPLRVDCARWLDEVETTLPSIVAGARDDGGIDLFDVTVLVDGVVAIEPSEGKAIALDPGPHVVRFERAGVEPVEIKIMLRAGERNRPVLASLAKRPVSRPTDGPPPPKREEKTGGPPVLAWVFGGIGIAGVGAFTALAISGSSEKDRLRAACAPTCTDDDIGGLKGRYIAADVSLGVGVVALALA
ncbi:MAG: hypothetical protein JST00_24345, partial [Deltaproteobacteria bacterium]|nr:hypothetical protein [Deltaproteobacteria bacterium]